MNLLKELLAESKQDKIKLDPLKPRNKRGNDVLRSKKSGRHYNAKTDYVRAKEKEKKHHNSDE